MRVVTINKIDFFLINILRTPLNMTKINFNQFYVNNIYIAMYGEFIDFNCINKIIIQLELIIKNIDDAYQLATCEKYKAYLVSMKGLAQKELELKTQLKDKLNNGSKDDISFVLTKDLELIPVVKLLHKINPEIDFGLRPFINIPNYIDNKDKLISDYLEEQEEQKEQELEDQELEDAETVNKRRKLVLSFEHPDNYIDEDGNYNYCYGRCCVNNDGCQCDNDPMIYIKFSFGELTSVVRSFAFRYKTKKYLNDLDKVEPYDYQKMKQSRQILHNELKALYKVFQRRMITIPMAVMIKLV